MPTKTLIEWTDYSSNPIYAVDVETGKRGWWCTKVSPGCAHCYSARRNLWIGNQHDYVPAEARNVRFEVDERELDRLVRLAGTVDPEHNKVFICDMTDLFHEAISDEQIARVFDTMAVCEGMLTFQVLTKRPERALEWFSRVGVRTAPDGTRIPRQLVGSWPWPLRNVWFGVSVENQFWADRRIPLLAQIPAVLRFLSCEPLLGPLDICDWLALHRAKPAPGVDSTPFHVVDWVIAGGESAGPMRRALVSLRPAGVIESLYDPDPVQFLPKLPWAEIWPLRLRDQCVQARVPFFWKQWGGPHPTSGGRLLAGNYYNQMPTVSPSNTGPASVT